jgi:THUMP domain-like
VDIEGFQALFSPAGREVLAEAADADLSETGLLASASRLRSRYPTGLVAAALTQLRLRARARDKFGPDAARMYFTPAGLEQSTRSSVAVHRARRFAARLGGESSPRVLDLCCGIAADLVARARAGCPGEGVDLDPLTVAVARANLETLGLSGLVTVREGDAVRQDPSGYAAVFADPGRRTARGRVFDPRAYEPPLDVLLELVRRAPAGCVKVAPGIPHSAIPADAEAEWISDHGEVKEAALWLGGLRGSPGDGEPVRWSATVLRPRGTGDRGGSATLTPDPGLGPPPVGPWLRYLYEPDGAVIRAHLVAEVAALTGGTLVDRGIAYVTSDTLTATPFASAYEIDDVLPFSLKKLRAELRRRGVGALTIKKRGSAVDVERLRRDLRLSGPDELTLVLTRIGAAPFALLCRPARADR